MCCVLSMNLKGLFHEFNPSKFLVYLSCLLFVILLGLRLDNFLVWSYFIVFIPLWIWKAFVLIGGTIGTIIWVKHPEYRRENSVDLQAMFISFGFHMLLLMFELLLSINLQLNVVSYRVVFIPLYCMSVSSFVACVWGYRHERQLELETFFSVNTLQFICISLKWDRVIEWSWVVVFVPIWIILTLLSVCVLYYIIWALLFMRSPEITALQRKAHIINAIMSCLIVIPLLAFMVMFTRKLDGFSNDYFTTVFIPLELSLLSLVITSFYQKGGNQWWFGMRKDFCEFLLEALPLLREYGNTSYKFADTIVSNANGEEDSNSSLEMTPTRSKKRKETQKLVGTVLFIDAPD